MRTRGDGRLRIHKGITRNSKLCVLYTIVCVHHKVLWLVTGIIIIILTMLRYNIIFFVLCTNSS